MKNRSIKLTQNSNSSSARERLHRIRLHHWLGTMIQRWKRKATRQVISSVKWQRGTRVASPTAITRNRNFLHHPWPRWLRRPLQRADLLNSNQQQYNVTRKTNRHRRGIKIIIHCQDTTLCPSQWSNSSNISISSSQISKESLKCR